MHLRPSTRTMTRRLLLVAGILAGLGLALGAGQPAAADPVDLPPERTATAVQAGEDHSDDFWCWNPIAPLRHPARPPTNPPGVIQVGASVRYGPFVPPLPCFDLWWTAQQGLARFDLTELTRRGYVPGYFRAELRAKSLPDVSANPLPNTDPTCDQREIKIEPLASGEWNLTDRNTRLNRPDLLVRMSGSGTADITPLVEFWLRGGANHGLSFMLSTNGYFSVPLEEAHGEIDRRCMRRFALTLQVTSTITGSPLELAPQPVAGAGMKPPMMGTDQPMVVRGVARRGTAPARVNESIVAFVNGRECGRTQVADANGRFTISVASRDQVAGCGQTGAGQRVTFQIGPTPALQTLVFAAGPQVLDIATP